MRRTIITIAGLLVLLVTHHASAQAKRATTAAGKKPATHVYRAAIKVLARAYGDSIVIRWAPDKAWAWTQLNATGYIVERIEWSAPGMPHTRLTSQPLKPMPLDQMKRSFAAGDRYAAIAAQCLYGANFNTGLRKGHGGQVDQASVFNLRYGMALEAADFDGAVAKAEGLRWTDTHVQPGAVYVYVVYPGALPAQGKIDTGGVFISDSIMTIPKPRLADVKAGDSIAELHWSRFQKVPYTGYLIDRSEDGKHFKTLNEFPFYSAPPDSNTVRKDTTHRRQYSLLTTSQVFLDSLPRNYHNYSYRIRGLDAFGETSDYSDTLSVAGRDLTPPKPPIVATPHYMGKRSFQLNWKRTGTEKDFAGWVVTRATKIGGPYAPISSTLLAPGQLQFTDTGALVHRQNYYIVIALDTAGNMGPSLAVMGLVPDTTPPAPPVGLRGRIDPKGRVFLTWNHNAEDDIKGYKVYFANGPQHAFSQLSMAAEQDTTFVDSTTLNTLTKYIWYKVVAVDRNNNHSKYSEALRLKRPDIVPPMPPEPSRVTIDSAGVHIDWMRSPSTDVVGYILYRRRASGGDTSWTQLTRLHSDTTKPGFRFTDTSLVHLTTYQYNAEAVDEDSLHSKRSVAITAAVNSIPELPAPATPTASYDANTRQVTLKWAYRNSGDYYYVLYRAIGPAPLARFQTVAQSGNTFRDTLPSGGPARYAIQVLFKDNRGKTRISDPVAVTIP